MEDRYSMPVWKKRLEIAESKRMGCISSWEGFIPKETRCSLCEKDIYFNSGDKKKAIHFDHRNGGSEKIKGSPTNWLKYHSRTSENEKIWEECDFGMLCLKCNLMIPTQNRDRFIGNLIRYNSKND